MSTITRRVQRFGKSTLMVSLPAEWVRQVNLKPGDEVLIEVINNMSIRITPLSMLSKLPEKKVKVIISRTSSEETLTRCLYATYILGYDKIIVESKDGYLSEYQLKSIRHLIRNLIGLEIVEYTPNKITMQVFVDPTRYPVAELLKRMCNLLKFMVEHFATAVIDGQHYLLHEVEELENEIDRLYTLVVRQLLLLAHVPHKSPLGLPLITEYRIIAKSLEDSGDAIGQAAVILKSSSTILRELVAIKDLLRELTDTISLIIDRTLIAFDKLDLVLINELISHTNELQKHITRYDMIISRKFEHNEIYTTIRGILDRFRIVSRNLRTIAEIEFDVAIKMLGESIDISKVIF